jgi:TM2 domain-containing membrane protein YozV
MKIKLVFLSLTCFLLSLPGIPQSSKDSLSSSVNAFEVVENKDTSKISSHKNEVKPSKESKRFVAAVLCLTLGPFGMHRLYLGSTPQVAAAYSVTLGAIGIVPVVDFLLISFSKDISRFKNNGKVIMWGK